MVLVMAAHSVGGSCSARHMDGVALEFTILSGDGGPRQRTVDDDAMLESHHDWATETVKLMAEAKMIRRKEFKCVLCSMKE